MSAHDAERLLNGEDRPDDAFDAPNGEAQIVAGIATAIRAADGTAPIPIERGRSRRVPAKVTVIAFAAVLASGTAAAAAANGSLPPRVQRAVSSALAHVHISVPKPPTNRGPSFVAPGTDVTGRNGGPASTLSAGSLPPASGRGPGSTRGNGNATHTSPSTPARGDGNGVGNGKTTTRTLPAQANGNGSGLDNGKKNASVTTTTRARGNGNNTTRTLPPKSNGNGNTNTTHTLPPKSNGNGNGSTTHTTPSTPGQGKKSS